MRKLIFTIIAISQLNFAQNFWGLTYNFEFFSYNAKVNYEFIEKFNDYPQTEAFKLTNWEFLFLSRGNLISLLVSIGAGPKYESSDLSTSANAFASMSIGIGTKYFEIYAGGKLRALFDLKQKALDQQGNESWTEFKNSNFLISYALFQGIRLIFSDIIVLYAEINENFYPFGLLKQSETTSYTPAFTQLTFTPISARLGVGIIFK